MWLAFGIYIKDVFLVPAGPPESTKSAGKGVPGPPDIVEQPRKSLIFIARVGDRLASLKVSRAKR